MQDGVRSPLCATLWTIPEDLEEEFEAHWEGWIERTGEWGAFFETLESLGGDDLLGEMASEGSHVMHALEPSTYNQPDSWLHGIKGRSDVSPGLLAERCRELMDRRRPGHALPFVVDEVGQFVARDVQKMLDVQGIVHSVGRVGRGRFWLVATSQEKLDELVSGLDDTRVQLARLMDRFPTQAHLEPSDISEVTSRRVLTKTAKAHEELAALFEVYRGKLTSHTALSADITLPALTREAFIELYPLLPYQIDLIIQVVSGLRTQGGSSRHVGGANRTINKLAQQLLINPVVDLASRAMGHLVKLDHIYDLVEDNISGEVRAKLRGIPTQVTHPKAHAVAKAICLLQYVKSVHRTAANVAAVLHPAVDADSELPAVTEALHALEQAHLVRHGNDGYRIPTPAEDDWERTRSAIRGRPADIHRLHAEVLESLFQPAPSHRFLDTKLFKAGLTLQGREVTRGDLQVHLHLADDTTTYRELVEDLRKRSQQDGKAVFWAVCLGADAQRATDELFRSREMILRKKRRARRGRHRTDRRRAPAAAPPPGGAAPAPRGGVPGGHRVVPRKRSQPRRIERGRGQGGDRPPRAGAPGGLRPLPRGGGPRPAVSSGGT